MKKITVYGERTADGKFSFRRVGTNNNGRIENTINTMCLALRKPRNLASPYLIWDEGNWDEKLWAE